MWLDKSNGYYKCILGGRKRYIHRLVASLLPNPDNKPTVNHKDGNRQNNHISNLEWATYKEQIDHKRLVLCNTGGEFKKGVTGKDAPRSKPIIAYLKNGEVIQFAGISEAGRSLGIERSKIKNLLCGYVKSIREGHSFKYLNS